MKPHPTVLKLARFSIPALTACMGLMPAAFGQHVTFSPYIQLGDNGRFGPADQIVIAWQTDEAAPNPGAYKVVFFKDEDDETPANFAAFKRVDFSRDEHDRRSVTPHGRVIDNYLAVDPSLPSIPTAYGAHTNYTAVLRDLRYDAVYQYRVTGPGMPIGGFSSWFRTRKVGQVFSFAVEGDEGYF